MNPTDLPPVIDAHVHFWDPALHQHDWLDAVPSLNGPRLPSDFVQLEGTAAVRGVIFVEAACHPAQSVSEADWVASLADREPRIVGIIAHAPLEQGADVRAHLETLARRPLVRGVRRLLQDESDPEFCLAPAFLEGTRALAEFGFTCDLCIRSNQLAVATELVRRCPQVSFVLDHLGKPEVRARRFEPWASQFSTLAGLPNVACKLSGLATEAEPGSWTAADVGPYLRHALACFGPDRVLFGSDWPVASLATPYARWLETVRHEAALAGPTTLRKLFSENAARIYRVQPR